MSDNTITIPREEYNRLRYAAAYSEGVLWGLGERFHKLNLGFASTNDIRIAAGDAAETALKASEKVATALNEAPDQARKFEEIGHLAKLWQENAARECDNG